MSCSTSSGARPGASVPTSTCTVVTSGNASTLSRLSPNRPPAAIRIVNVNTRKCWRCANEISPLIMARSIRRREVGQLGRDLVLAAGDDALAEAQAVEDLGQPAGAGPDAHVAQP